MQEIIIEIENISKKIQKGASKTSILDNVSFSIFKSEMLAITGKSGSGKSTLLSILAGLDPPTNGKIKYWEKSLYEKKEKDLEEFRSQNIGIIFQNFNLINELNCLDNIEIPLIFSKKKIISRENIDGIVESVHLEKKINLMPAQMSGGEQQRAAVARAIVNAPAIIFADEPTGALDSKNAKNIIDILENLRKTQNTTIVIITHDAEIAERCDRKLVIRDGKLA